MSQRAAEKGTEAGIQERSLQRERAPEAVTLGDLGGVAQRANIEQNYNKVFCGSTSVGQNLKITGNRSLRNAGRDGGAKAVLTEKLAGGERRCSQ